MKVVVGAIAIAASLATTGGARADCAQAATSGVWSAYAVGVVSTTASTTPFWLRCTLTFDQSGNLVPRFSACTDPNGNTSGATGHLTLSSGPMCAFAGVIDTHSMTNTVTQATFTQNKQAAAGVGTFTDGGFAFNMIKVHGS